MRIDPRPVTDAADPRIEFFTELTDMDLRQRIEPERGLFMAEGHLIIDRCARAGLHFHAVLTEPRWLPRLDASLASIDAPVYVAERSVVESITGYRVHRGALAAVSRPAPLSAAELLAGHGDVLVLEDLVDPTNVGLAIRSAVVQGIDRVVLSPGCADPLYRKAVKSSMGSVLRCQWARSDAWGATIEALAESRRLIALTPDGPSDLEHALGECRAEPVALAFGSEGPGLSEAVLNRAWRRCAIPMRDPEDSLNVAAAVAVATYARSRSMLA